MKKCKECNSVMADWEEICPVCNTPETKFMNHNTEDAEKSSECQLLG